MEVKNPCNGKCWKIDHTTGDCLECLRTRDEVNTWWDMSSSEKREVLRKIQQRQEGAAERSATGLENQGT